MSHETHRCHPAAAHHGEDVILREDGRTLVFQVAPGANKIEIKRAIEQLLGAKVDSIRTSHRRTAR